MQPSTHYAMLTVSHAPMVHYVDITTTLGFNTLLTVGKLVSCLTQ